MLAEALASAWSVTSTEEATGTLNRLLAGMHAPRFGIVHPLAQAGAAAAASNTWSRLPEQHRAFLREVAAVQGMDGGGVGSGAAGLRGPRLAYGRVPGRGDRVVHRGRCRGQPVGRTQAPQLQQVSIDGRDERLRRLERVGAEMHRCRAARVRHATDRKLRRPPVNPAAPPNHRRRRPASPRARQREPRLPCCRRQRSTARRPAGRPHTAPPPSSPITQAPAPPFCPVTPGCRAPQHCVPFLPRCHPHPQGPATARLSEARPRLWS